MWFTHDFVWSGTLWEECYFGEVLFKKCSQNLIPSKTLISMATKWNFLSNSLKIFILWNCWSDFEIISQMLLWGPFSKIFAKFWSFNKHGSYLHYADMKKFLTLSQTSPGFYMSAIQVLWNDWAKKKLLVMSDFSFSQCFLPSWETVFHFLQTWSYRLQTLSVLKSLKFVVWEKVFSETTGQI